MLVRPGSGRPMLSNVCRPMISGLPRVIRLKCAKSDGRRHGIPFRSPITPLAATAAIIETATLIASQDRAAPAPGLAHATRRKVGKKCLAGALPPRRRIDKQILEPDAVASEERRERVEPEREPHRFAISL